MKRNRVIAAAGAVILSIGFAAHSQAQVDKRFSLAFLYYTNGFLGSYSKANPERSNTNNNLAVFQLENRTSRDYLWLEGVIVFERSRGWEQNTNQCSKWQGGNGQLSGHDNRTISLEVPPGTNAWRFEVYLKEDPLNIAAWRWKLKLIRRKLHFEEEDASGEIIILTSPEMRR